MPSHTLPIRVYYEDTDAGGIVYHANYLRFAERARTEFLRQSGLDHGRVRIEHNIFFIVRHAEIDYKAPARLDDLLEIRTEVTELGNTSLTMKQSVWCADKLLNEMKIVVVAVNMAGRAVRIPPQLRQILGE